jgi:drug/metabolite transporter (DMT)-like permease
LNVASRQRHWLLPFVSLAAIWGSSFWLLQMASHAMGPWTTSWLRVSLAGLMLLPLVIWRGQTRVLLRHARMLMVVGFFNSGLPFALYGYALMHISTGLATGLVRPRPLKA